MIALPLPLSPLKTIHMWLHVWLHFFKCSSVSTDNLQRRPPRIFPKTWHAAVCPDPTVLMQKTTRLWILWRNRSISPKTVALVPLEQDSMRVICVADLHCLWLSMIGGDGGPYWESVFQIVRGKGPWRWLTFAWPCSHPSLCTSNFKDQFFKDQPILQ